MHGRVQHVLCWTPTWRRDGAGLEHALVAGNTADSVLLAVDDDGQPFRLTYRLQWDDRGRLRSAEMAALKDRDARTLSLRADGEGRWTDAHGEHLPHLDGCIDIDIWPTPLTNSFPIWRSDLKLGERQAYRMAWVSAPDLAVEAKPQAYTRLADRLYRFESLDGSGFEAVLPVDEHGFVIDYPALFRRVSP